MKGGERMGWEMKGGERTGWEMRGKGQRKGEGGSASFALGRKKVGAYVPGWQLQRGGV